MCADHCTRQILLLLQLLHIPCCRFGVGLIGAAVAWDTACCAVQLHQYTAHCRACLKLFALSRATVCFCFTFKMKVFCLGHALACFLRLFSCSLAECSSEFDTALSISITVHLNMFLQEITLFSQPTTPQAVQLTKPPGLPCSLHSPVVQAWRPCRPR